MKIEFIKPYQSGILHFDVNDQFEITDDMKFESMNDLYYILIVNGLRYDIKKEDVKIIK
ncbi:hypothetical protein [Candidatus Stoquefichus massiliensis]|uniref:hypothetical protein n=1 Tax=Candidatus Stoquefichus massiliensis TaxID=1470350 RepID=UPI0004AD229D|nr:hypothetical protein [Candidatus Stoquefichus massiliensis]